MVYTIAHVNIHRASLSLTHSGVCFGETMVQMTFWWSPWSLILISCTSDLLQSSGQPVLKNIEVKTFTQVEFWGTCVLLSPFYSLLILTLIWQWALFQFYYSLLCFYYFGFWILFSPSTNNLSCQDIIQTFSFRLFRNGVSAFFKWIDEMFKLFLIVHIWTLNCSASFTSYRLCSNKSELCIFTCIYSVWIQYSVFLDYQNLFF